MGKNCQLTVPGNCVKLSPVIYRLLPSSWRFAAWQSVIPASFAGSMAQKDTGT